ncbi:MAG: isochorismatase family protein [Inhella sp.]|nr:isochorismatase family protein [Inhella sp.]
MARPRLTPRSPGSPRGDLAPPTGRAVPSVAAAFGPVAHNAWHLDAQGTGMSLVRTPLRPKPVLLVAQPQCITLDIVRSVLVVVDMQNDFCHPKGWFAQKGIGVKPMRKPIAAIAALLPAWRAAGGTVLWLNWGVRADRLNLPPLVQFKGKRSAGAVGYAEVSPEDRGRSLVPGEWGAQVVDELAVAPEDITVFKHRLSGFWDNELDSILRLRGATTLLFAGVNTDRCVFSTLQDAGFLGYDAVLLEDACSTPSPAYVTRAIHFVIRQLHGFTARSADLIPALAARSKPRRRSPATPR